MCRWCRRLRLLYGLWLHLRLLLWLLLRLLLRRRLVIACRSSAQRLLVLLRVGRNGPRRQFLRRQRRLLLRLPWRSHRRPVLIPTTARCLLGSGLHVDRPAGGRSPRLLLLLLLLSLLLLLLQ